MRYFYFIFLLSLFSLGFAGELHLPEAGGYMHGCYPGGVTGEEDDIRLSDVLEYEKIVGRKVAWVYFSNNWYADRRFPMDTATWIRDHASVPYIRLMLRSRDHAVRKPEKYFSLKAILGGKFDADLRKWGRDAARFGSPLIVEYGTEVNGEWFGWNGKFHGGGKKTDFRDPQKADGPERFVSAYRHLIEVIRSEGATNITWVFHLDASESPSVDWNRFENYYPGSNYVDWIGVSCYGPQRPMDDEDANLSFREKLDPIYQRILRMAPEKPVFIAEFGCTSGYRFVKSEFWAQSALNDIFSGRWANVRGFSWWNERWQNDEERLHDTTMRVQDHPALGAVFRSLLKQAGNKLVTEF